MSHIGMYTPKCTRKRVCMKPCWRPIFHPSTPYTGLYRPPPCRPQPRVSNPRSHGRDQQPDPSRRFGQCPPIKSSYSFIDLRCVYDYAHNRGAQFNTGPGRYPYFKWSLGHAHTPACSITPDLL
ncbi:hypothetical protein BD779DRAFT_119776 [Infundibulicybe gibba]|nr:hypothetical protein BD779DRAFT_119776 [Infundibulicybe gibba]